MTTFSIANDIAKYFAIIPAMFTMVLPQMQVLNIMHLATPASAILSALIFNAIIIPALIPIAMKGVKYKPMKAEKMLLRNMGVYGLGGIVVPFVGIKLIDLLVAPLLGNDRNVGGSRRMKAVAKTIGKAVVFCLVMMLLCSFDLSAGI